jgi:hypothetical protein
METGPQKEGLVRPQVQERKVLGQAAKGKIQVKVQGCQLQGVVPDSLQAAVQMGEN